VIDLVGAVFFEKVLTMAFFAGFFVIVGILVSFFISPLFAS
jgi:hypothetical protein